MFTVESSHHNYTVRIVCDTLAEAQNLSGIRDFCKKKCKRNRGFEDAETIAIYVRDEAQGVKFVQTTPIHPQTLEQRQATQEMTDAIKAMRRALRKKRLVSKQVLQDAENLRDEINEATEGCGYDYDYD